MARTSSLAKPFALPTPLLGRPFDLVVAALALLLLSPPLLFATAVAGWRARGAPFEREQRVGRWGHAFYCYRLRLDLPGVRPSVLSALLQRLGLARLPLLFNVLNGDMSIVGPEAERPDTLAQYELEERSLLTIRPGLFSPGQLYAWDAARSMAPPGRKQGARRVRRHRVALDLVYFQRRTLGGDFAFLFRALLNRMVESGYTRPLLALRNRHFFLLDIFFLLLTPALALALFRDGFGWWPAELPALLLYSSVALAVKLALMIHLRLYDRFWRYASVRELLLLGMVTGLSTGLLTMGFALDHPALAGRGLALPRTLPLLDGLLSGIVLAGPRFAVRALYSLHRRRQVQQGGQRVLVVGAGEAGLMTVKEMLSTPALKMMPIGFVDDDESKLGSRIHEVTVLGTTGDIPRLVLEHDVERITMALPSAPLRRRREILATCKDTGVIVDRIPGMYELLAGYKTIDHRPQFSIHRILRRPPIESDVTGLYELIRGQTVLVTGAGGSIGSELCRQVARFGPAAIVLLGHGENSIFEVRLDLALAYPGLKTHPAIVDVRDQARVAWAMERFRPSLVFHAAAHKHVPLMEESIDEAITNNVLGSENVLHAANEAGVERLVLISTDKAINPTNIMGATKRIAELLVRTTAQQSGRAYMAVRFGNVLGSRGSVLQVFQRQIVAGGPVTVTHPDMHRFFMSIPEAVSLVLQAALLGHGNEVFVLDMGKQVRIEEMARELIRLHGLAPDRDIEIVYSGIRPGEKLREELFLDGEHYRRTRNPKIFVATNEEAVDCAAVEARVEQLVKLARARDNDGALHLMREMIPDFHPFVPPPPPAEGNAIPSAIPQPQKVGLSP